jgi:hypothetical protein
MNQRAQIGASGCTQFRITTDQVLALCDQGIFDGHARSELVDGEIVVLNAQHSRHARVKSRLVRRIGNALEAICSRLEPQFEASVRMSDGSRSGHDIVLTSFSGDGVLPVDMVALLVEVSDTTLKAPIWDTRQTSTSPPPCPNTGS